jgi:hypothetical protein
MTERRRRVHRDIRRYAHPRAKMEQELTKFQLAAIGAVALAYSELEVAVDTLLSAVAGFPRGAFNSITTEVTIASIIKDIADVGLEAEDQQQIIQALTAFRTFAVYRNVINHVRLMNLMSGGCADSELRKPKSLPPFSDKALNIFYDHLIALEKEFSSAAMLVQSISLLRSRGRVGVKLTSYSEGKRAFISQFRGYGTRRQALPSMPWLPSESDLRAVKIKWRQAQQAEMMAWLTAWPEAGSTIESGAQG